MTRREKKLICVFALLVGCLVFYLKFFPAHPGSQLVQTRGGHGPRDLHPSLFIMENEFEVTRISRVDFSEGSVQTRLSADNPSIDIKAAGLGRIEIRVKEQTNDGLFSKGYWDAILGIGDDRQGRANIPGLAVKEFGGLKKARHFNGNSICGYILTPEAGVLLGRLWTGYDQYFGDFVYYPEGDRPPDSWDVARLLMEVDNHQIRAEWMQVVGDKGWGEER